MFGSLWGKKKEPVILGGKSNGVPGMPAGLYSSKDVENLRFHDKRRVWYNAQQVDDALDTIQATLEWWESKYGLKPGSGTEPADAGMNGSLEAGADDHLGIDVDHLAVHDEDDSVDHLDAHDEAGSEPVLGEQAQSDGEHAVEGAPEPTHPVPVAEPADERAGDAPVEDSEGETTAVIAGGSDGTDGSTADGSPDVADSPESEEHKPTFDAVRAKPTVKPAPTFDLNLIAQYRADDDSEAVDSVVRIDEPVSEKPAGEPGRAYREWARLLSASEKPAEEPAEQESKTEPESKADSGGTADSGETAHAVPSITVPEVPPVPVIPTNPFLRRG